MIISRTPLRMSFFGGGTDLPEWYMENSGAVLSVTIDKYIYITCRTLPPFFDYKYYIVYSQLETANSINDIRHPSIRESLHFLKIDNGLSLHYEADLPARSGLGSSSSFTVGLLNALYAYKGSIASKSKLAKEAIYVERELLKEAVGAQDQTAAAYGGFNYIKFKKDGVIDVRPFVLSSEKVKILEANLVLFFTGFQRTAANIEQEKIKNIAHRSNEMQAIFDMVLEGIDVLNKDDFIEEFGRLLDTAWRLKKCLSGKVTTSFIDDAYELAKKNGAIGGKILGAGGGGFLLFVIRPEKKEHLIGVLKKFLHVPFCFDNTGTQIVYYKEDY